ncbi:MAG: type III-A CRISPR-associated protein Cas10/Csm1 [Anaerolineae bacterium]
MRMNSTRLDSDILIAWAVRSLAGWVGARDQVPAALSRAAIELLEPYGALLSDSWEADQVPRGHLTPILALVSPDGTNESVARLPVRPLAIDKTTLLEAGPDSPDLWPMFVKDFERLSAGGAVSSPARFEAFTHLLRRYAWAVPCTYGGPGISLYEEFKALAALAHASRFSIVPGESFLLVAGDIPGIQDFLYTITSQAAAKGLRGRSFFLQLLADGLARRLLKRLGLPSVNIVYEAGGNFLLLAPPGSARDLEEERQEITRAMLVEFQGDLGLALAWEELPAGAVRDHEAWREVLMGLKKQQAREKERRFAGVIQSEWETLFSAQGRGGERFCVICHRELGEAGDSPTCDLCASFRDLAESLGHDRLWMAVEPADEIEVEKRAAWQEALARLSGWLYRFGRGDVPKVEDKGVIYTINDLDFVAAGAYGFRLLADVTPRVTHADVEWAIQQRERGDPSYAERLPRVGDIRDFDMLARDGEGIQRVGVLRMDVDNLGQIFSTWQPARAMAGTSALSSTLGLFFNGWLRTLVKEAVTLDRGTQEERLAAYVIYAGGDDLFIVGTWHLLPMLAERIYYDFYHYTRENKHLCISAGISLMERAQFPLYQAAEQAREALDDQAKGNRWVLTSEDGRIVLKSSEKSAICFLGEVVGWDRWPKVRELQENLVQLCRDEKVPRALLGIMRAIYGQFLAGRREYEKRYAGRKGEVKNYPFFHGRWMWMGTYRLERLAQRGGLSQKARETLESIGEQISSPQLPDMVSYVGLAARWAEYRTRKEKTAPQVPGG